MMRATAVFLVASVAIGVVFGVPNRGIANHGKADMPESNQQIDWYTCTEQGNYPDPTSCDHYIACTTANLAYRIPCAMDPNDLFDMLNSYSNEQPSYCDYQDNDNIDCSLVFADEFTDDTPTISETTAPSCSGLNIAVNYHVIIVFLLYGVVTL